MAYGYNNRYRSAGGYRPSSRNYARRRNRRNYRRIRNRAIIIISGLLVVAIAVAIIVGVVNLISGIVSNNNPNDAAGKLTTSVVEETKPSAKAKKKAQAKAAKKTTDMDFVTPKIPDDGSSKGSYDQTNGLYVYNKAAYELFYGSESKAKEYAEVVNSAKESLGSGVNVYSMIIPNHTEMGLPARLKNTDSGVPTNSQSDYIKTSYKAMDSSVTYINAYNNIAKHCDEYIYFDSDHHWTGLGAYYAYEAFAEKTKQTPVKLSDLKENTIKDFTGSFTEMTSLPLNKDTVHFWSMPFDIENTITQKDGHELETETLYYWDVGSGDNSYGVFLFGDNPTEVIKSSCETASDEKIAIIHESYGNALVPYFTANYKEIHSIDFRYFSDDLASYCKENGIKNVLFANGVMSSATETQLESMRSMIG